MKSGIYAIVICLYITVCGSQGLTKDTIMEDPESVTLDFLQDLYDPVVFDHQGHADMYDCGKCHHHTTGGPIEQEKCLPCHASSGSSPDVSCSGCHRASKGSFSPQNSDLYHIDKPGLLGALHLKCLGCHRSESGPTGCTDCHDLTGAGRTRFALEK
jgi:hypothetical protein